MAAEPIHSSRASDPEIKSKLSDFLSSGNLYYRLLGYVCSLEKLCDQVAILW